MRSFKTVATLVACTICVGITSIVVSNGKLSTISDAQRRNHLVFSEERASQMNMTVHNFQIDKLYQDEHRRIDRESVSSRCGRYNLEPYDGPQRRLFYGALIADDNLEVLKMHAIETYGIYHVAVFIEANTSFIAKPRALRFKDSEESRLLTQSNMFGSNTSVYVDFWLKDWQDLLGLDREAEQRNEIIKRWKKAGMKPEDVAIKADADEFFSRDFLRAVQSCDFPELRPDPSCHRPKIVPSTISFEMSPYCIKAKPWFHPDIISGHCVDGIGDPTERVVPLRTHERRYGERDESYGRDDLNNYPEAVHKARRYPLFTVPDIRTVHGDRGIPYNFKDTPGAEKRAAYGVAYHFHNWFADLTVLRKKYRTYSHTKYFVNSKTLSQIDTDLGIVVRCVKQIYEKANHPDYNQAFYAEGWNISGPRPIFFLNKTYLHFRHKLVLEMILEDEEYLGLGLPFSIWNWILSGFRRWES